MGAIEVWIPNTLSSFRLYWEPQLADRSLYSVACDHSLPASLPPGYITLSLPCGEQKSTIRRVNYWNIIADTLDSLNKARLWNSRNLSAPDKDAH